MLNIRNKNKSNVTVSNLKRDVSRSFLGKPKVKLFSSIAKLKRFYREYRLPSIATASFILIILSLFVVRQLERTSLLALINEVTEGGNGYSTLLSSDAADQFTRNDTTEENNQSTENNSSSSASNSTQSTSTPFSIENTTSSSGTSITSVNNNSGSSGSGSVNNNPKPVVPFEASIGSFKQNGVSLLCTNPSKPKRGSCSKVYSFGADIKTANGPGTVSYNWQSDVDNSSGSFSVGQGSAITAVSREITILCTKNVSFYVQLAIVSPALVNSNTINVNHNCNEI